MSDALTEANRWYRHQHLLIQLILIPVIGLAFGIPIALVLATGIALVVWLPLGVAVLIVVLTVLIWILRRRSSTSE